MNRKGIQRGVINAILVLTVFTILLSSSFSSSLDETKTYSIGQNIKLDLTSFQDYRAKIITPSSQFLKKGSQDFLVFKPQELGFHKVQVSSENKFEEFHFLITEDNANPNPQEATISAESNLNPSEISKEPSDAPSEENSFQRTSPENNSSEDIGGQIRIGLPVKHTLHEKISGKAKIKLPVTAHNISLNSDSPLDYKIEKESLTDFASSILSGDFQRDEFVTIQDAQGQNITIQYYTAPPQKEEKEISSTKKEIIVSSPDELHYENVLASTQISEFLTLDQESLIKLYWEEESRFLPFRAYDTNNNSLLDYIEWTVPHLSTQTFQIIIEITSAQHLDSSRNHIQDIYDSVFSLDNLWSPIISPGEYVRVVFEQNLTSEKDITIFPRILSGSPIIQIYEKDQSEIIAEFTNLQEGEYNKVYLTSLEGIQDTFDLRVIQGSLQLDHILDPAYGGRSPVAQIYQTGLNDDVDTETSIRFDQETIVQSNFSHPTNSQLTFNAAGLHKISYACTFRELGTSNRRIITSWIEDDGIELYPSRTYCYVRQTGDDGDRCSTQGVLLASVGAGSQITLQSSTTGGGTGTDQTTEESCWLYAERVTRPVVQIFDDTDLDFQLHPTGHRNQEFDNVTHADNDTFTVDLNNHWISVDQDGWYKAYFTGTSQKQSGTSDSERQNPASYLALNNNTRIDPSLAYSWHKRVDQANITSEQGFTLVNLTAGQNISLRRFMAAGDANNRPFSKRESWLFLEKLDDDNALVLWDSAGGQTSSSGGQFDVNITWNEEEVDGSNFTHAAGSEFFTIDEPGLFEISYAVGWDDAGSGNRFIGCGRVIRNSVPLEPSTLCDYSRGNVEARYGTVSGNFIVNNTAGDQYAVQWSGEDHVEDLEPSASWITVIPVRIVPQDLTPPEVTIASPLNQTYLVQSIDFNISLNELGGSAWFTINSGATNYTMSILNNLDFNYTNSSIPDGTYTAQFYANDSQGNLNDTESVPFTIDTTPPIITIHSPNPSGNNYSTSSLVFNISLNEPASLAWYTLDGGTTNTTLTSTDNTYYNDTNSSIPDGQYTATFYANDSAGNLNTTSSTFTIDTITPSLNLDHPQNQTYTTNPLELNFSVSDTNLDSCWYTLDSGTTNVSISLCQNTTLTSPQGSVNLFIYANDSAGNENNTNNVTFFVDSLVPLVSFEDPTRLNGTSFEFDYIFVNVSIVETNFQNITFRLYNKTGLEVNTTTFTSPAETINWTDLNNNNLEYYYNVTVFDQLGNVNVTETRTITLTPGDIQPPIITIHSPNPDQVGLAQSLVLFNVSLDETGSLAWYTLDGGTTNTTLTSTDNTYYNDTNSSIPDGTYQAFFYANDTSNNVGFSGRNFTVDTQVPGIGFLQSRYNLTDNTEDEFSKNANPQNPERAIDEDFSTFSRIDSSGGIDILYINYTRPPDINTAYLEYLADWDLFSGSLQCFNSSNQWQTLTSMVDNARTNVSILSQCLSSEKLEIRAFRSLSAEAGIVNFYEEQVHWDIAPKTLQDNTNISQSSIPISVLITDNNIKNITFQLYNSTSLENSSFFDYDRRFINFSGLPDGTYQYNVTVFDVAHSSNTTQTRQIILDTKAPNASLISPENNTITSTAQQNLTVNISDSQGIDNATLFIFNQSNDLINQTTQFVSGTTQTLVGVVYTFLTDGIFSWFYQVVDIAGNTQNTQNNTITIDTTPPAVNFTNPTPANGSQLEQNSIFVNVTTADINFANITYLVYNSSSEEIANQTTFNTSILEINFTSLSSANTTYTMNVTTTDLANNQNTTQTITINLVDLHSPDLSLSSPANITYNTNTSIALNYIASDPNLDSCWYTLDSGTTNITLPGCSSASLDIADEQSHTLILYSNDSLNLINQTSVTFFTNSSLLETTVYRVQRGSLTPDGISNAQIDPVQPTKSFALLTARSADSGPDSLQVTPTFPNSSTLQVENHATGGGATVEWEVITGPNITSQRSQESYGTTTSGLNVSISEVNLAESFIIIHNRLTSGTGGDNDEGFWTGRFVDNTTIELRRGVTGDAGILDWQVVEWQGTIVQSGSLSSAATYTNSIISQQIQANQSLLMFSRRVTGGGLDDTTIGGYIANETNLGFYRLAAGGSFAVEWFVVEAPFFRVDQRNFSLSGGTASNQAIRTLTNSSKAFHRSHSSSTGGGTSFANSFFTSTITSETNLQLQKGTTAQTNNASWQVVEIIELESPKVNLLIPQNNSATSSTIIPEFNFSVYDQSALQSCTLYGSWGPGWHANQTLTSGLSNNESIVQNFSSVDVLTDGTYQWNVECLDIYDNQAFNSTNFTFFVDSTTPLISYVNPTLPSGTNISRSNIFINISVTESNEQSINFSLFNSSGLVNSTLFSTPQRTINFSGLQDGTYQYNVIVLDILNNSNTTQTRQITLDTKAPNASLISPENNTITSQNQQNLTVNISDSQGIDNATLFIFNQSNDLINQTTQFVSGTTQTLVGVVYTFLTDGIFSWFYQVVDIAGNTQNTQNNTITIDTTVPLINFTAPTADNNAQFSKSDIFLNVTLTELSEKNITFYLYNSTNLYNSSFFSTPRRQLNFTSLPDGTYQYNVTVFDVAHSSNTTQTRTITLDTTPPQIKIDLPQDGSSISQNTSIELNVSQLDLVVGLDSCWWNINHTANQTITCGQNTTFNATDGQHIINFYANDSLNNIAYQNSSFTISTAGPAITLEALADNLFLNYSSTIEFNYTPTDPDGVDTCSLYGSWGSGWHLNQTNSSISNATTNHFYLDPLPDGQYLWNVFCNDSLNLGAFALENNTFTIDTINSLIDYSLGTETDGSNTTRTNLFINVSVTESNEANITFRLLNTTSIVNTSFFPAGRRTINFTSLPDELYRFDVTVRDLTNKQNTTSLRKVRIDTTPPQIKIDHPLNASYSSDQDLSLNFTIMEPNLDSCWYTLDSGTTNVSISLCQNTTFNASQGTNILQFYANDTAGAVNNTESVTFFVDSQPPAVDFVSPTLPSGTNLSGSNIFLNVSVIEAQEVNITFYLFNSTNLYNSSFFSTPRRQLNFTSLPDGTYQYNVTVFDVAHSSNTTQTRTITLDTKAPNATLLTPENNTITSQNQQNLTVNISDSQGIDNATLFIFNQSNDLINQTTQFVSGTTQTLVGVVYTFLTDGIFSWFYQVVDIAGNTQNTQNNTITIDTTPPAVNFTNPTPANGSQLEQNSIFVNISLDEVHFSNITYIIYQGPSILNLSFFNTSQLSLNFTDLNSANTTYTINVSSQDLAGNINTTELRQVTLVDTLSPALSLVSPQNISYTSNESLPLNYIVSDPNLNTCWYTLDGGTTNTTLSSCANSTFSVADQQSYNLTLYANDSLSLINQTSVVFHVNTSLIITTDWVVQRGTTTADGTQLVNINTVDKQKSFILHSARSTDSGPDTLQVKSDFITTNDQIEFENYASGAGATIEWEVVTGPNLTVQRGTQAFSTTDQNFNLTISPVQINETFIIISSRLDTTDQTENQMGNWRAFFINETTISLNRGVAGEDGEISWQIVQWQGAFVQNGSLSVSALSGTQSLPQAVNLSSSFLIFSKTTTSANSIDFNTIGGYQSDSITVAFYRDDDDAGLMQADWFVVEAPILDVRRGSFDITGASSPTNTAFTAFVNLSRSFNRASWDSTGSGQTYANGIVANNLTTTSNLHTRTGSTAGNVKNVSWQSIEIVEVSPPEISLVDPTNHLNFTSFAIPGFNYTVNDTSPIENCTLYGSWNASWHANQTSTLLPKGQNSFAPLDLNESAFYTWNVECADAYDNIGSAALNFTFGAFLFPIAPELFNISQNSNSGVSNITLIWNSSDHALSYRIYNSSDLRTFSLLNTTFSLNYTDTQFSGQTRRFYRIDAFNPSGQNSSAQHFGTHVYTLRHSGNTRNWIAFPSNSSYLKTANQSLHEIKNLTAFTAWNKTTQTRLTCNTFSCPVFPSCTSTNCNFNIEQGEGYEANLNSSEPSPVNWSMAGIVYKPQNLSLVKNTTSFGKNWIAFHANTTIADAQSLLGNITNSDAATLWSSTLQTSQGLIPNPFPFGPPYLGTNFPINPETGYEVSVTANTNWTQI